MLFIEKFIKPNRFTVMLAGICALMLTMGIARYAFTPMIPRLELHWLLSWFVYRVVNA